MKIGEILSKCDKDKHENYIKELKPFKDEEAITHIVKVLRSLGQRALAFLLLQDEKTITVHDLDNERVNLEKGLWMFHAKDLLAFRSKMKTFLKKFPNDKRTRYI